MSPYQPFLHEGVYAFASVAHGFDFSGVQPVVTVREREGITLVLSEGDAESAGLAILFRASWITLGTDTELTAVGITAAVASVLASEGIACNVIAGAHHDHLFVPVGDGARAVALLERRQQDVTLSAERDGYTISTAMDAVDIDAVHAFLTTSYWAEGIPRSLMERAVRGSLNFSLFHGASQVGFARVVTDRATFAWLCDVYVLEGYRGKGLGHWLIDTVMAHPDLQGLRRFSLGTRDAHSLYAGVGFTPLKAPERHMEIARPGLYLR